MAARRARTNLNGVLLLDKPPGLASNTALQHVRHLYGRPKAGHTGTLDPLASGLLPICFGEATKFGSALLAGDKRYDATVRLGYQSSTGDAEGELTAVAPPKFSDAELEAALNTLTGSIWQIPPMYSALKVEGAPLYRLARQGREIERAPRAVRIHHLRLLERTPDTLQLSVGCSKGTYIRVLAEDLGRLLGCGGYLTALRRTAIGSFTLDQSIALATLEAMTPSEREDALLAVDTLVLDLPRIDLSPEAANRVINGLAVAGAPERCGPARLYDAAGRFLGLGEVSTEGTIVPKRMVAMAQETV
jgi:tRNA pseudouridine55 synthase